MISAAEEQERTKVVQTKLPSSNLVLLPFTTGLDPFEQIAVVTVAAKNFRRRHERGGARMAILPLPLSWVCENDKVGGKAWPFNNVVINYGC